MQFTAGQHRFEHVTSVHGAFSRTSTDDGVHFISEKNYFSCGVGDLFEHSLETLLKFPSILCASHESPEVQLNQALSF